MKAIIKMIFNPGNYGKNINVVLLMLRVVAGVFMLTHGLGKFQNLMGNVVITFKDPLGIGATASLTLAVFSEVFCSIFLALGFATRFSALSLLITMLVAALLAHAGDGFGKQELPLLYAAIYLALMLSGSGKISLDKQVYDKLSR